MLDRETALRDHEVALRDRTSPISHHFLIFLSFFKV